MVPLPNMINRKDRPRFDLQYPIKAKRKRRRREKNRNRDRQRQSDLGLSLLTKRG